MSRTFRRDHRTGQLRSDRFWRLRRASFGCRNHGSCGYCRSNRLHSTAVRQLAFSLRETDHAEESLALS